MTGYDVLAVAGFVIALVAFGGVVGILWWLGGSE